MTTLHADSMATYPSAADVLTAGYNGSCTNIATTGGRFGLGAITQQQQANGSANGLGLPTLSPGESEFVLHGVYRPGGVAATVLLWLGEGTTNHLTVLCNGSGVLTITRNGTLLATASTVLVTGTDYAIALDAKIHDTAGALDLYLNDVAETLTFASGSNGSQDTRNGGTGVVDNIRLGSTSTGASGQWSEVVVVNKSGSSPSNQRLPGWRVYPRQPSAAGNYQQMTPNASTNISRINQLRHDSDTTYLSDGTAGHKETYQFGQVPWTAGTIVAVVSRIVARKDDAGVRQIRDLQRQSGSDSSGTTRTMTTAYAHYRELRETNPATAAAFTTSELRATDPEFGLEIVA